MGQICSKGNVVEGEQAPVQEDKPVLVEEAQADAAGLCLLSLLSVS